MIALVKQCSTPALSTRRPAHFPSRRRRGFSRLCSRARHGYAPPTRLEAIEQSQAESRNLPSSFGAVTVIGLTEEASARLIDVVTLDLLADLASLERHGSGLAVTL